MPPRLKRLRITAFMSFDSNKSTVENRSFSNIPTSRQARRNSVMFSICLNFEGVFILYFLIVPGRIQFISVQSTSPDFIQTAAVSFAGLCLPIICPIHLHTSASRPLSYLASRIFLRSSSKVVACWFSGTSFSCNSLIFNLLFRLPKKC